MNKRQTRFLLISFILILFACGRKKIDPVIEKIELDFPNCKLSSEEIQTSYGITEKVSYRYDQEKLVRRDFYYNNEYNSTKLFTYDDQNFVHLMLTYDSTYNTTDTIGHYEFEDNRLTTFIHYNTHDNSVLLKQEFEYENSTLKYVTTINDDGQYKFIVETDDYGNPVKSELIEQDYSDPSQHVIITYEYDDKLNPYYKLPDFVGMKFFSQNNIINSRSFIDGTEQKNNSEISFEYFDNKLPQISKETFGQGTHITTYEYICDPS